MQKTALALAIPLAVVAAGVAGAWYTGSQVEAQLTHALEQANAELDKAAPGAGLQMTLLGIERGFFASQARYQLSLPGEDGEAPCTLVFADRLEHGPFPPSRLARGKLLPVMAQSNFTLEQTPFAAPLFAASAGQPPFSGAMAIGYDGAQQGEATLAALSFSEPDAFLQAAPLHVRFDISADYSSTRMSATLASLDLVGVEPESGTLVRLEARELALAADKTKNAAGFALGPGSLIAKTLLVQAQEGPVLTLHDAKVEETLSQQGDNLDQTLSYRVGRLELQDQPVGSLTLTFSARHLDQGALKALADTYNHIAFASVAEGEVFDGELTAVQQEALKNHALRLLDGAPSLALDELSMQTANGEARLSLSVDLRQPDPQAPSLDAAVNSALAELNADLKIDKALVGDLAALQAGLEGMPVDPALQQQQAALAGELFSGLALNTGWVRLDGNSLTSSLSYANDRVRLNGREMSVEQFVRFALGSVQGAGLR